MKTSPTALRLLEILKRISVNDSIALMLPFYPVQRNHEAYKAAITQKLTASLNEFYDMIRAVENPDKWLDDLVGHMENITNGERYPLRVEISLPNCPRVMFVIIKLERSSYLGLTQYTVGDKIFMHTATEEFYQQYVDVTSTPSTFS